MTVATIDTLGFARKLREGGLDERTADNIAQEIGHFVAENVASSIEVTRIKSENADIKADIAEIKERLTRLEARQARLEAGQTRLETNQNWLKWAAGLLIALVISDIILQTL